MQGLSKHWDGAFALKIVGALGVVALADWQFYQRQDYAGAIGLVALGIVAALALVRPAVRKDKRALIALGLAALAAFGLVWDTHPLPFALFWISIGLATLLPGTARFDDGWRWFQRLFIHGLKSLFGPLIDLAKLSRIKRRRPPQGLGLRHWLKTLALPLFGSAVILALFSQANPLIEQFFSALQIPSPDAMLILRMILWGFIGLITWGVLRPRPPRFLAGTFDGRGDAVIPGVSLASVTISLIAFNALFALQNLMDIAYLWGLAELPQGITLAEYAHRGAYPLVVTALLAAAFVLIALRPGSQTAQSPLVRALVMSWIAQNLLLVASAALRTWDYVEAYDLTQLRISALLWMGLVAIGLVLVLWRMLGNKSAAWLINANLATSGALLFALCFIDLGEVAARWNVQHAREIDGTGAKLDWCYLNQLDDSALIPLAELEQRQGTSELGKKAASMRAAIQDQMSYERNHGWTLLGNRRLAKVQALLGPAANQPQANFDGCYRETPMEDVPSPADQAVEAPTAPALTAPTEQ
jgi:hypothetical protein